jgi:hypothetical protein
VSVINDMNTQIASAAEEQSAVADDINRNVINIGQVANEVAGGADESSAASAGLTKLAEQQRRLINQFRFESRSLRQGAAAGTQPGVRHSGPLSFGSLTRFASTRSRNAGSLASKPCNMQRRFGIEPGRLPRRIENQRSALTGGRLGNHGRAQPHLFLHRIRLPDRREKQR